MMGVFSTNNKVKYYNQKLEKKFGQYPRQRTSLNRISY